jgi:hypothetical protein
VANIAYPGLIELRARPAKTEAEAPADLASSIADFFPEGLGR